MKYSISKKLILGLFIGASLLGSCTKDFEELNTNPNNPTYVPANNIFTNAEQAAVARQMGGWIQHTYLGVWCQQWCKVQYIDEDRYMPRDMSGEFQSSYISELKNLAIVIKQAEKDGNIGLLAAAKIMRVYSFMYVTDVWGDIPYTEALQGFDAATGILKPKYDTQSSIYEDMFNQLEEANQLLAGVLSNEKTSDDNFGGGDLFYGGETSSWRKFANTLKLRLLNRAAGTPWTFTYNMAGTQADVTTTAGSAAMSNADTRIAAILANPTQYPVFTSNDDNAAIYYPGLPYRNPIYNTLYTRTDQGISETMVDWLKARTDPRVHVYGQPTPESVEADLVLPYDTLTYKGFQNGRKITAAYFPGVSLLGTKIAYDQNAPLYALCYDEMLFTKAEHYKRVGNDAAAQAAYESAIEASFERWGLDDAGSVYPTWFDNNSDKVIVGSMSFPVNYSGYLASPLVTWSGTDAHKYQLICEQRWAAMFGQGVQAYCEVRRTGFPERIFEYELEGAYYPNLGLPIRLQYALSEDTYNTTNVSQARSDQKIEAINEGMFSTNGITAQVWWNTRKNPIPTETDVH